jgi:hypothetical protein
MIRSCSGLSLIVIPTPRSRLLGALHPIRIPRAGGWRGPMPAPGRQFLRAQGWSPGVRAFWERSTWVAQTSHVVSASLRRLAMRCLGRIHKPPAPPAGLAQGEILPLIPLKRKSPRHLLASSACAPDRDIIALEQTWRSNLREMDHSNAARCVGANCRF